MSAAIQSQHQAEADALTARVMAEHEEGKPDNTKNPYKSKQTLFKVQVFLNS